MSSNNQRTGRIYKRYTPSSSNTDTNTQTTAKTQITLNKPDLSTSTGNQRYQTRTQTRTYNNGPNETQTVKTTVITGTTPGKDGDVKISKYTKKSVTTTVTVIEDKDEPKSIVNSGNTRIGRTYQPKTTN